MPERRPPTHTLTIAVPLNLKANPAAEEWDIEGAMAEAMKVILPIIRVGTLGLLCDQIVVTMKERPMPDRSRFRTLADSLGNSKQTRPFSPDGGEC